MSDRLDSVIPIGSNVFCVLPDDDGRHFLVPLKYTGYDVQHTLWGKDYVHYGAELDPQGNPGPEEEIDIGLVRWTEFEALEAFKLACPAEPVFGVLHQPTVEEASRAEVA
jgi:hypothetical protein